MVIRWAGKLLPGNLQVLVPRRTGNRAPVLSAIGELLTPHCWK